MGRLPQHDPAQVQLMKIFFNPDRNFLRHGRPAQGVIKLQQYDYQ